MGLWESWDWTSMGLLWGFMGEYGGVLKWGYPKNFHFNGMFRSEPTILGIPICGNPHISPLTIWGRLVSPDTGHQMPAISEPASGATRQTQRPSRIPPLF